MNVNYHQTSAPSRTRISRGWFLFALIFIGQIFGSAIVFSAETAPGKLNEIIILHDNDIHFDFNHHEAFKKIVDGFRNSHDNVFLFNAGDIFTRNPIHEVSSSLTECRQASGSVLGNRQHIFARFAIVFKFVSLKIDIKKQRMNIPILWETKYGGHSGGCSHACFFR